MVDFESVHIGALVEVSRPFDDILPAKVRWKGCIANKSGLWIGVEFFSAGTNFPYVLWNVFICSISLSALHVVNIYCKINISQYLFRVPDLCLCLCMLTRSAYRLIFFCC